MMRVAKREHALLGARLLLVAAGATESEVEAVTIQRLPQRLCFHDVGVQFRSAGNRIDAALEPVAVDVHDQIEIELARPRIAERDHFAEFPRGIDVQQRERQPRRIERLERQVEQNRGVLADGIEHHRILGLGDRLAHDVDAFGLELLQVGQRRIGRPVRFGVNNDLVRALDDWGEIVHDCPAFRVRDSG